MKKTGDHKYSDIESFDDFRFITDRLVLKSRLTEAKIRLSFVDITRVFSFSNLFISVAKTFLMPKLSDLLGFLMSKVDYEDSSGKRGE